MANFQLQQRLYIQELDREWLLFQHSFPPWTIYRKSDVLRLGRSGVDLGQFNWIDGLSLQSL
jgi:hypothetical protein